MPDLVLLHEPGMMPDLVLVVSLAFAAIPHYVHGCWALTLNSL